MATLLDTLVIAITGDARGIEQTINKSVSIATGAVGQINKQEVDWTSIFSRAVTPAIISAVASTFAFAIDQSIQFQTALNQTGTAAGESTAQIAQLGQSALGVSSTVPSSAQDVADAMTAVGVVFGNTADQAQVVQQMAELSAAGFGNLSDIVSTAIPIFQQFGVTTTAQATQVLTDMMHAAESAKESIPDLASQFSDFSQLLSPSERTLAGFNGQVTAFGASVAAIGSSNTATVFAQIASSSQNAGGNLEQIGIGIGKVQSALSSGNVVGLLGQLVTDTNNLSTTGATAIFGSAALASVQELGANFKTLASDQKTAADSTQTITQAYAQVDNGSIALASDWNKVKASFLDSSFWQGIAQDFVGLAGHVANAVTDANNFLNTVGTALSNNKQQGDLNYALTSGFSLKGTAGGNGFSGLGFSASQLSGIDQLAQNNSSGQNLLSSLLSSLQTGIKGGQYSTLVNTFHLTVPPGSVGLTAKAIATQLYNQFQGYQ